MLLSKIWDVFKFFGAFQDLFGTIQEKVDGMMLEILKPAAVVDS